MGYFKTMISDFSKAFGYAKFVNNYLGAFTYGFNRRFELDGLVARFLFDVSRPRPSTRHLFRPAQDHLESASLVICI